MNAIQLLRTELVAKEVAFIMHSKAIKGLIKYAHESKIMAERIMENQEFEDYNVTPKSLDFDIKALTYNLKQLRRALEIRLKQPFQDLDNGMVLGMN